MIMENILQLNKVSVSYGKHSVLKQINLDFPANEITAIIGPSGCGKSTLLKTLNRMMEEEGNGLVQGEILFQGKSIYQFSKEAIRQKIGIVFQNPTPFPFSIYKNMIYALNYHGINKSRQAEIVEEKLKLVGLYDEVKGDLHKSALKLSGGQQQRLCLARTLTVEPQVILLDEPCSALDPKATAKIEEALINLTGTYTIIVVTHNLAQAKRIADKTAFILDGQLIEYGNTEELLTNPQRPETKAYLEYF